MQPLPLTVKSGKNILHRTEILYTLLKITAFRISISIEIFNLYPALKTLYKPCMAYIFLNSFTLFSIISILKLFVRNHSP